LEDADGEGEDDAELCDGGIERPGSLEGVLRCAALPIGMEKFVDNSSGARIYERFGNGAFSVLGAYDCGDSPKVTKAKTA
jgi:hypothetical protein